jgi:leucyl aminopeptidase
MPLCFADPAAPSLPLYLIDKQHCTDWLAGLTPAAQRWLAATGFDGSLGDTRVWPGADGAPAGAVMGTGDETARQRGRFWVAKAAATLPAGVWHLADPLPVEEAEEAALGWLLAGYRFGTYRSAKPATALLKPPANIDATRTLAIANAEVLTRDLINTPANDLGPDELQAAFEAMAARFGAAVQVTTGEALQREFPLIHAVGQASPRAPRLLDMRWGTRGPRLTLVGKGVCFDTGGLDLKPSANMLLMKKDMGGAATTMGLAQMVMALNLPVRLRLLVPAVENAVAGNAMRPRDIYRSRKGLTVEINNTDAEGRLVLADALALAAEERPDWLISMATLTGAARVAVGPDLSPYFTDDPRIAAALDAGGAAARDPVWRLPFWAPYEPLIEPGIADLDNAPSGGFAGAITAALFLRRFAEGCPSYTHFDIFGWNPADAPARPKGGVGMAARAVLAALPSVLGL